MQIAKMPENETALAAFLGHQRKRLKLRLRTDFRLSLAKSNSKGKIYQLARTFIWQGFWLVVDISLLTTRPNEISETLMPSMSSEVIVASICMKWCSYGGMNGRSLVV